MLRQLQLRIKAYFRLTWPLTHRLCIETYLRLTWPFIVGQLLLMYFLVGTSQGYEIVLSSTETPFGAFIFIIGAGIFSWLVWMLTRTVISLTGNHLYPLARNEDKNNKQRRWPGFYCFHLPCYTSVVLLVGLSLCLIVYSGKIWTSLAFTLSAVFLCWVWWHQRLGYARTVLIFCIIGAPLLFLFAAYWPVTAAGIVGALGSYNIAFVGFLFLMALAALLLIWLYSKQSALFYTLSVFLAIWLAPRIVVWVFKIEPHPIRCAESCDQAAGFPLTVDEAVRRWNAIKHPSRTMVVVAAAGGGARAAYWTASVLGAIQDQSISIQDLSTKIQDRIENSFARHLFAISGVSGGALGGAAFAALGADPPTCRIDDKQVQSFKKCLSAFLSYDFLRPVMASALTGDLFLGLTGIREIIPGIPIVDRAAALERSWETAWGQTFRGTNWMEAPFDNLWLPKRSFRTNLLLNGTIADAGKLSPEEFPDLRPGERVVTSNLLLGQHADAGDSAIANPAQWRRISLGTAIDDSTRFPFVEPVGAVPPANSQSPKPPTYYVADGGYYDNYGAATLLDLLRLLAQSVDKSSLAQRVDENSVHRLIIIQISSDSEVSFKLDSPLKLDRTPASKSHGDSNCGSNDASGYSVDEVLTPYHTAMAAREWSGLSYALQLRDLADPTKPRVIFKDIEVDYFHFGLHDIDPPLGWSLSEISRACIDHLLDKNSYVYQEIGDLVKLLTKQ